jgi:hypothetical protein
MRENELIIKSLDALRADVKTIKVHLFEGEPGRPSIREELASLKAKKGVPDNVWKGVAAVLLAVATAIGGYAGLTSANAPPEIAAGE